MEKRNPELFEESTWKRQLDEEMGHKPVFSIKDKKAIMNAISHPKPSPSRYMAKWLSTLTLGGLAFAILFFALQQLKQDPVPTEKSSVADLTQVDILTKVDQLEKTFRVGMTVNEITNMVGTQTYEVVKNTDTEDGTIHDLKFNLYNVPGFMSTTGPEIDETNLLNGNIGIQLFIGMNPDETADRMSILFVKEDVIMLSFNSQQVQFVEPVHEPVVAEKEAVIPITLTAEERELYVLFQKDLNIQHLKGIDPMTIAKLYVQAGYDHEFDVQYELYTDREEFVQWSKEEHMQIPLADRGSGAEFNHLDEGTFIQTDEISGYIEFNNNGSQSVFQMVKNEDGVWQVHFMPLQ